MSKNYELLHKLKGEINRSPRVLPSAPPITRAPQSSTTINEAPISAYLTALWRRRWTVVGFALLVTLIVGVASFVTTPTYESVARIAIYRDNQSLLTVKQDGNTSSDDSDYTVTLDTQAKLIESDELATGVIRTLGLDSNPQFVNATHNRKELQLEYFHDNLQVTKVPHTRLLEIRFHSPNPRLAADVANALANAYIDHTFKVRYDATMLTSKRLADDLVDLQKATNSSEAKLVAYQRSHGLVGSGQLVSATLAELSKDLTAAEVEKADKQEAYDLTRSTDADQVARIDANSLLERLRSRESEVSTEYAKVRTIRGPANPQVIELKNQLDDIRRSIVNELDRMRSRVSNEYLTVAKRETWLRRALETQKQQATQQNQDEIEYNNLKREADTNRQLYADLLHKLKEAELAAGLGVDNIRIEALATVPLKPSKPNIPFNLAMALFGGMIGGIVLGLVRDNLDDTIRNAGEAEIISGSSALVLIPHTAEIAGTALDSNGSIPLANSCEAGMMVKSDLPMIESYRALRSQVLLYFSEYANRVLLVTSSLPGEGKTTTAINAALVFAQNHRRVLLLDADLRKSSIHKAWQLGVPEKGLSTVLAAEDELEDALLRCPNNENLFILPAGPAPADPAELLGGDRMERFISKLKQQFDYIIIDSPPVLAVSDTLILTTVVDAVLLVVRESKTPKLALAKTCELLHRAKAPTAAIVINGVKKSRLSDYHYYDSSWTQCEPQSYGAPHSRR
jgi:succinoglycan biosynthesis transport protein ExoP